MCTPFGACLAFKGIRGSMTLLHGSQGCATYIRRYMISHFREPIDIASSNFTEETAIFGGQRNFNTALENVIKQYSPEVIGIATTCLSETIGDDLRMMLREFKKCYVGELPEIIHVSTPSYNGTHTDGYYATLKATVKATAKPPAEKNNYVNVFSGMVSAADLRHLRDVIEMFTEDYMLLPDYAETLDGPSWDEYVPIPDGGTDIKDVRKCSGAMGSIELYKCCNKEDSAGEFLDDNFDVKSYRVGLPIGIKLTDKFMHALEEITGNDTPACLARARGRLVDAYIDAHKYLANKRAIVFGDEEMVLALCSFLCEIGVEPIVAATGGKSGTLSKLIKDCGDLTKDTKILEDQDFEDMAEECEGLHADFLIGNSKGFMLSEKLELPLIRVGMPVHDRFGAARIQHLCYDGTQQLFDRIVNCIIKEKQVENEWGYTYM